MDGKISRQTLLNTFFLLIAVSFSIFCIIIHEPWRDEGQAWAIAKEPISVIFQTLKSEGHPILWFLILHPFASLGFPFEPTIAIISLIFVSAAEYLLFFKSSLPNTMKFFLAISPVMAYVYAAISRVYSVCVFLIVLLAILYKDRDEKPILYAAVIALLMQTHMYIEGIVLGAGFVYLLETIGLIKEKKDFRKHIIGLAIMFVSGVFLILELAGTLSTNKEVETLLTIDIDALNVYWDIINSSYVFPLVMLIPGIYIFVISDWKNKIILTVSILFMCFMGIFIIGPSLQRVFLASVIFLFGYINYPKSDNKIEENIMYLFGFIGFCSITVMSLICYDISQDYSSAISVAEYINENLNFENDIVISAIKAEDGIISALIDDNNIFYDPIERQAASYSKYGGTFLDKRELEDILQDDYVRGKQVYILCIDGVKEGESIYNIDTITEETEEEIYFGPAFAETYHLYKVSVD